MEIRDLLNKDTIITALTSIKEEMDTDFEDFGALVILHTDQKGNIQFNYYGNNAEIIGLLDIGREVHLNHMFDNGELPTEVDMP